MKRLLLLAAISTLATGFAHAGSYSLRFFGTGSGDIDRVKVPLASPVPASRPVNVGGDFTVEFWLKALPGQNAGVATAGSGEGWRNGNVVVDRDVAGAGDFGDFGISLSAGRVAFGTSVGGTAFTLVGATAIDNGAWRHVAVTRALATGTMAIYVDGKLDASVGGPSGTLSYRVGRSTSFPNSDPFLVLGAEKRDAGASFPSFRGWLDEMRVSSSVRYAAVFARPKAAFATDAQTVALYHFDEAGGNILFDASGAAGGPSNGTIMRGGASNGPAWSSDTPFGSSIEEVEVQPFVSGLSSPIDIVTPPDGSGRLFVVQQGGAIRIIQNGALVGTPFLTLGNPPVLGGGERGLLSMVFHPNYATNGYFYVFYTASSPSGALTIARYSRSAGNPMLADPGSASVLLQIPHGTYDNHNGGKLLFGPDGFLYLTTGDGGSGDDPLNSGQTLSTLLGKLLRIDVNAGPPYAIPPDNPFVGVAGASQEIFAYGLRNGWRASFDRLTGDLYIGDVGQGQREEIDLLPLASPGGENFGWRVWEGTRCNRTAGECAAVAQVPPILEYEHSAADAGTGFCGGSVTGGYRYRGAVVGGLASRYVFTDYCTGRMWHAWLDDAGAWQRSIFADTGLHIPTFGEDANGEILFASSGTIYRFAAWNGRLARLPDLNGDVRSDLVWRNRMNGSTALWLMNGVSPTLTQTVMTDANWVVTHVGALSGGNARELVWRHRANGSTALWTLNGTAVTAASIAYTNPNWTVTHVADFDGNGRDDLLWRNTATGQVAIWLMNGIAATAAGAINVDPNWSVAYTGDFNGDGRADLVWRNGVTGQTAIWLMNGLGTTGSAVIQTNPDWTVTQVGNFNGDAMTDLLWRNDKTGETAVWLMNGLATPTTAIVLADVNWNATHVADFDGNGRSDIVWRNQGTGQTAIWLMNGLVPSSTAIVYGDRRWSVVHARDLNGDGRADLVWGNAETGQTSAWLMNGTGVSSSAFVSAPAGWSVQ
jgi:glucose/arabinose dehydrogenase